MLIFNLPTDKADLATTKDLHLKFKAKGEAVPYFKDSEGRLFYWDNKGKGRYSLKNLGDKYAENAAYRSRKLAATATEADYQKAWGKLGKEMMAIEKRTVRDIYRNNKLGQDVDHIQSLKSGGVHHSNNLRSISAQENRSRGNQDIGSKAKTNLMIGDTPMDTIKLQGPRPTSEIVSKILGQETKLTGKNKAIRLKQVNRYAGIMDVIQSNMPDTEMNIEDTIRQPEFADPLIAPLMKGV
tara:strand:- start:42 stop:761 length:720 start_codon:yes stop_codon:yes gene_type:complete